MKLRVADLYDLSLGLADLAEKELPISASLKVQRNQKNVSEELIASDKVRQKIINKYKEKDVEGGAKIKDEKMDVFRKEIEELMNQEVKVDVQKIDTNELNGISIKPKSLTLIESILVNAE